MISLLLEARAGTGVGLEDPNVPLGKFTLLEVLGGGSRTWAGNRVNEETAKTVSAVYSAVTTIASSLATLPIRVVQYRADGVTRDQVRDHPLHYLLNVESSPGIMASSVREAATAQLLLRGNAVLDAPRTGRAQGLELEALYLLNPQRYEIHVAEVGRSKLVPMVFLRPTKASPEVTALQHGDMLRLAGVGGDGVRGWSVVKYARQTLGAAMGQEEHGARFFSNDATPRGVLEHPNNLSPEAKDSLRKHWNGLYGGSENSHRVAVLEEGMEFKPIQMTAEDSQFIEARQFGIREVARWFNIPPHKLADLQDAKWANIDAQNLEYLQDTLMPWLVRWKQGITAQLLMPREREEERLGVEFDFRELLRGDVQARGEYLSKRFQTGSITPNEIRVEEGENPKPGGDDLYLQSQYVPVELIRDVVASQMAGGGSGPDDGGDGDGGDEGDDGDGDVPPQLQEEGRARRLRARREERAFQARLDLREAFMEEFLDRATRQVNGELREVKKLVDRHLRGEAQDPVAFQEGLHDYYTGDFVGFARDLYLPSFRTYAGLVVPQAVEEAPEDVAGEEPTPEELNAFVDEYTDNAVAGIAAGGRQSLVERSNREEPLEEVEAELANWESDDNGTSSRAQRIARRHVNELNQATSTFVWAALAVAFLVARAVGESCPYCNAIDGTRVAMGTPFFNAGDSLQPDGQDAALSFKGTKRYPPWHQGCDCAVRPEV